MDVVFDTIGGDALSRSPDALAQLGRVVSIVDIAQPQNLIQAWGKNAAYHFVFTRQNRGKLDELSALVAQGRLRPHVGSGLCAGRCSGRACAGEPQQRGAGKIAIEVAPA